MFVAIHSTATRKPILISVACSLMLLGIGFGPRLS
jgi:hypothetical protein